MCQKLIIEGDILAFLEKEEGLALGPPVSPLLGRATSLRHVLANNSVGVQLGK